MVDINEHIAGLDTTLRRLLGDIALVTHLEPTLWAVHIDPELLDVSLINLVANAKEAMPNGGTVKISTTNVQTTNASHKPEVTPGHYVVVAVTDTGYGMTSEVADQAFEPFFSTKPLGFETVGLGLSTCYGIVAQQGGHIALQSAPQAGTTVRLFLRSGRERESDKHDATPMAGDVATVLVVDDDPAVCKLVARILRSNGYRVIEAHSGAEALRIARDWHHVIHVLLTNVVMAEMSGSHLVDRLSTQRSPIPVIYMSGFNDNQGVEQARARAAHFIQKPFGARELLAEVKRALASRSGHTRGDAATPGTP